MNTEEKRELQRAVDLVCLYCVENTLENSTICENCPVREVVEEVLHE